MAKKDEEFRYGESSIPTGEKKYSIIRWDWNGLNRTDDIDTGQLSDTAGIVCDPPYIVPCKLAKKITSLSTGIPIHASGYMPTPVETATRHTGVPISLFYDYLNTYGALSLIWLDQDTDKITVSRYYYNNKDYTGTPHGWYDIVDFELGAGGASDLNKPRTSVVFNAVDTTSGNIMEYTYDRKQLIYPDCYSLPVVMSGSAAKFNTSENPIPTPTMATIYNSRVFGVTINDLLTASAFNSYVDYSLDTASDVSSSHAWASMAGSSTDADGKITAITTYDNHVVIFRKDFMQLVYNNKNPFRIVDVGKYGCDSNKSWTILNGVLFFASNEKIYAYTGGTPKEISAKVEVGDLSGAVLGSFKDTVWVQTKDTMYLYKPKTGAWSDVQIAPFDNVYGKVVQFATMDYGLAALVDRDSTGSSPVYDLYMMDWDTDLMDLDDNAAPDWIPEYVGEWWFETDLMALGRLDVRRVKKFSMLCQGSEDAEVAVWLLKDGEPFDEDTSVKIGEMTFDDDGYHLMRILTRQFSSTMHKLRFAGKGFVKIYAAELKISWGGDVYVEK